MVTPTNVLTTIQPLADRVVLLPTEDRAPTRAGLHIPHIARDAPRKGQVIAVGPGRIDHGTRVPVEVECGQTVLYQQYSGSEVTLDGDNVLIINEADILAVLR